MQDFTSDGLEYEYTRPLMVAHLEPPLGFLDGGTLVQVRGDGFVQGSGLVCRFGAGGIPVAARWLSDSLLECRSRARSVSGNVTLEVSINNQDFSSSGVLFEYVGSPSVAMLRPGQGPVGGGTLVEIQGGPFGERAANLGTIYCRFGSEGLSRAQRASSQVIRCVAPAHAAGEIAVEVSMNGLDFTSSGMWMRWMTLTGHRTRWPPSMRVRCSPTATLST